MKTDKQIIETITSFEAACKETGKDPKKVLPFANPEDGMQKASNANMKLMVIAKAMKGERKADYSNSREYKWEAIFVWDDEKAAFVFSYSRFIFTRAVAGAGSRFVFHSEELADHFGSFIDIHNEWLIENE